MNDVKSRCATGHRRPRRDGRAAAPLARLAGLAGIAMAVTLWLIPPESAHQSPDLTLPRPGRAMGTGASGELGTASRSAVHVPEQVERISSAPARRPTDGRDGARARLDTVADRAAGQDRRQRSAHPPVTAEVFDEEGVGELTVMQLGTLAMTAREPVLREAAVLALGERDGHLAIQALSQAIGDGDREVREAAMVALAQIGGAVAVHALGEVLQWPMYAQDAPLRVAAVDALGLMGEPSALAPLKRALADPDARVRAAAADALAELRVTSGGARANPSSARLPLAPRT